MQAVCPSYRFAADAQGQRLLKAFERMLEHARAWAACLEAESTPAAIARELDALEALCGNLPMLTEASLCLDQIQNVRFTLEKIREHLASGGEERAASLIAHQLPCFLLELREEIYFRAYVRPYPKRMRRYYRLEFADHHANACIARAETRYEVSIFVPAKDKLSYTRQCVESILRETGRLGIAYELILINHGSEDETQEYFESIPGAKVIQFQKNVRMMMLSCAFRLCEGRYVAFVSNDTVVTKDWLSLLLRCLKSDEAIISATPTTPNVSNLQGTREQYETMEEMAQFAAGFNRHDPLKWERRARIMPVIALYDGEKLNQVGLADRFYETMEFWDDDFSLRARRAGYKQMLCRDVFCHHAGSVTGKQSQVEEGSLNNGRKRFLEKNNVDPWGNGAFYDHRGIAQLRQGISALRSPAALLGLDCGFGDTMLQIANVLRQNGLAVTVHGVTEQRAYWEDVRSVCEKSRLVQSEETLLDFLKEGFGQQYDCIYLSLPLEHYAQWKKMLGLLHRRLKPGGVLMFTISHALNAVNYQWFSSLGFPITQERLCYLNPIAVERHLARLFGRITKTPVSGRIAAPFLKELAQRMQLKHMPEAQVEALLNTTAHQYLCVGKRSFSSGGAIRE